LGGTQTKTKKKKKKKKKKKEWGGQTTVRSRNYYFRDIISWLCGKRFWGEVLR